MVRSGRGVERLFGVVGGVVVVVPSLSVTFCWYLSFVFRLL